MASVNKVILVGNLGRDPETRFLPSGDAVTNVSIATTETWKDKSGEKQESTEWHRVAFFGRLAEVVGEYLTKGSTIYVEGSLQTRKWTDKEGVERFSTEIRADRMQMLGGGKGGESRSEEPRREQQSARPQQERPAQRQSTGRQQPRLDDLEDDIPF